MSNQIALNLTVQNGPQAGQTFKVTGGSQTIGRAAQNQIIIADPTVSKQHARISIRGGSAFVEDLNSSNGTFVNDQRVTTSTQLNSGDTLLIGTNVKLTVSFGASSSQIADLGPTYMPAPPAASPAGSVSAFSLAMQHGPRPGQTFALTSGIQTIGRAPENQIHLPDSTVSKRHARLTVQPDGVYLQDLGSANGTFVNGQRITTPTLLQAGDTIQVGTSVTLGLQGPGIAVGPSAARGASAAETGAPQSGGARAWIVAGGVLAVIIMLGLAAWLILQSRPVDDDQVETVAQATVPIPTQTPTATAVPEVELELSADRTTVQLGECVTLRWRVAAAKEVRLDGESMLFEGNRKVCPQEPQKTYRLTALSLNGETKEQSIVLTVPPTPPPPPELNLEFSADRSSINYGDCTMLRWRVENAQEVRLAGDKVGAIGAEQVCPIEPTTSYKLVIQPLEGASVEQVVTISVLPTPVPTTTSTPVPPTATPQPPPARAPIVDKFIADQYNLNQGGCTSLRWNVRNAQSVQLSGGEIGSQSVGNEGGRQVCPPAASTTYNLVATGPGGSDQRALTISLSGTQVQPNPPSSSPGGTAAYTVRVGKHIYEQPWGAARGGDVCQTYRDQSWDDEKPFYRGFNIELLLTNNSTVPVPDDWGEDVDYVTANGKGGSFCYYGYDGSGPPPGATSSLTFFALIDQGDYVRYVQMNVNGTGLTICLDGSGVPVSCQ